VIFIKKYQVYIEHLTWFFLNMQVFIPVNIKDYHWYLMVINAPRREIQFLDSFGDSFDRQMANDIVSFGFRKIQVFLISYQTHSFLISLWCICILNSISLMV
jgi:Ulp1 family protease